MSKGDTVPQLPADTPVRLFTRLLREWREAVEWQGKKVERFAKVAR